MRLLTMLGFTVERDVLLGGRQIDLLATMSRGPITNRYILECKAQEHRVTTAEYDSFLGKVSYARSNGEPLMGGIFVTTTGFVKEARAQAPGNGIKLIEVGDLEQSLLDLHPPVTAQVAELRQETGVGAFVEPGLRQDGRTEAVAAMPVLRSWLFDKHKNHLTLLGDFGVGKTTVLKRLTVEWGERFLAGGATAHGAPAPVYLDLRQADQTVPPQRLLADLLQRYGIEPALHEVFWTYCREGRAVILLDGFDELASRSDAAATIKNFREINRSAVGRSKFVLSCRTHYFVDDAQVYDFHGESMKGGDPVYSELYQEIAGRPNFEIHHLEDFQPDQISAFVGNRLGSDSEEKVWEVLHAHYNLVDLARRPGLLEMIIESLDAISDEAGEVTSALLYQVYTNIWLDRNDWQTSVSNDERALLIETLARELTLKRRQAIDYADLPDLIREADPEMTAPGVEECDRELRRAGFLIRDRSGSYRFAHKSFQEFFLAMYCLRWVKEGAGDPDLSQLYGRLTTEVFRFVCDLVRRDEQAVRRGSMLLGDEKVGDTERCLLIKFLSRSKSKEVAEALDRLVADLRQRPIPTQHQIRYVVDLDRTQPLALAVTALGWLRQDQDPSLFVELVEDEDELYMVRHNALIALLRSRDPGATAAVAEFVGKAQAATVVTLFSSRIATATMRAGEQTVIADAIVDRWSAEPLFADHWLGADADVSSLCALCERSSRTEAGDIMREIAGSTNPRAAATAVMALRDEDLKGVEDQFLTMLEGSWTFSRATEAAIAGAAARFGSSRANDRLVGIMLHGQEETAMASLRALGKADPALLRDVVYADASAWSGKNWSQRMRLEAARLLWDSYPEEVARDLRRLLRHKKISGSISREALSLLAQIEPQAFGHTVRKLLGSPAPPAIVAFACDLFYGIDADSARALALEAAFAPASAVGRRLMITATLRSDLSPVVTEALLDAFAVEEDPEVRTEMARALIVPGRQVPEAQLQELIANEEANEPRGILELALEGPLEVPAQG